MSPPKRIFSPAETKVFLSFWNKKHDHEGSVTV